MQAHVWLRLRPQFPRTYRRYESERRYPKRRRAAARASRRLRSSASSLMRLSWSFSSFNVRIFAPRKRPIPLGYLRGLRSTYLTTLL